MKNLFIKLIPVWVFLLCNTLTEAQNINFSGNVTTNTTWSNAAIDTVKITGNVTIDSLVTLTIEPGIVVDFTGYYFLNVKGTLHAVGTVTDSIRFTTRDTLGHHLNTHTGWAGIRIHARNNSNDTTRLSYCVVEFGKANGTSGLPDAIHGGGLYFYQSWKIILNHSSIRYNYAQNSGGGLYEYYSFVNISNSQNIKNCVFKNNKCGTTGGAIYTQRGLETTISNCSFIKNTATISGGAVFVENTTNSRAKINNSRFSYNSSPSGSGGAISVLGTLSGGYITNSILNNNSASNGGAIQISQALCDVKNCVIVNNTASGNGGGIYFFNVFSNFSGTNAIVNNTIAHNTADLGGGFYIFDNTLGADLYVNKSIFYNNASTNAGGFNNDVYLMQSLGSNQTRFYSCSFTINLANTTGNPTNFGSIFTTNPQFTNPSLGIGALFEGYTGRDWSLNFCTSPCIDATSDLIACTCFTDTDINGAPRKTNTLVDIGAYESDGFLIHPQSISVCVGDAINFSYDYFFNDGSSATSYWEYSTDGGTNYTSVASSLNTYMYSTAALLSDHNVLVRVRHDYGCREVISNVATITVYTPATITANTTANTICQGNSITLTGSGAVSYSWDNGVSNGVAFAPSATTTYTVIGTSANGCATNPASVAITVHTNPVVTANATSTVICSGASVTLTGDGALSYNWSHSVVDGVSFSPSATTTYTVTGTDVNNCQGTADITVMVNQPNVIAIASTTDVCVGNSVTLSGDGAVSYTWSDGVIDGVSFVPAATNTYTVTGTDANSCTNTANITITVNDLPVIGINASSTSVCAGSPTILTASGALTYQWMPGGLSGTSVNVSPTSLTTYTVTGIDANNCVADETIVITVLDLPNTNIGPDSLWVCNGEQLLFELTNTTDIATYTIQTSFQSSTDAALSFVYNGSNPPALVQCTSTGTNGCVASQVVFLNNNSILNLSQGIPTGSDPTYTFHALFIPTNVTSWMWNFGDGTTAGAVTDPTHTFTTNGNYDVCLIAINDCDSVAACFNVTISGVGIEELNDYLKVYPNLTDGIVFVESTWSKILFSEVLDVSGRVLQTETILNTKQSIDLGAYQNGIYFIRLNDNHQLTVVKIILQR